MERNIFYTISWKKVAVTVFVAVLMLTMAASTACAEVEPEAVLSENVEKTVNPDGGNADVVIVDEDVPLAANNDKTKKPVSPPERKTPVTGVTVKSNSKASVDISNINEGYVMVKYTGGRDAKIRVLITKKGGTKYTYTLNNKGTVEIFPLVEGDGKYDIGVYDHLSGDQYATSFTCTVEMKLRNDFLPFLYPNQYVNYRTDGKVAAKAKELAAATDLDTLQAVFSYVVKNLTYDYSLAKSVTYGYLPDVEKVLENKKGICFDYASLMSSMLRIQNIPCKLVVGYAGKQYHAWINVYIENVGWVDKAIYFDGTSWSLMDPTFVSSAKSTKDVANLGDDYYTMKYVY